MKDTPDQLPVILLTIVEGTVPALIAARGPHAEPPLRRIFHRQHPQPEHAPRLLPGDL